MNPLYNIWNLYTPLQPALHATTDIIYTEFKPYSYLQHFIYCYWELKSNHILENDFLYKVVSDGCIDIFTDVTNPDDSYVMGFSNRYAEFNLGRTFHYAGIRFLPGIFPQLFHINAMELTNKTAKLEHIHQGTHELIKSIVQSRQHIKEFIGSLDQYFANLTQHANLNADKRIYLALNKILQQKGQIQVDRDLDTGISPRQLRRLFEYYIGDTAKSFSRVIRFQHLLHAKPSGQSLRDNKVFFDVGYYDQAHFIKEFRNFHGLTPGEAFAR